MGSRDGRIPNAHYKGDHLEIAHAQLWSGNIRSLQGAAADQTRQTAQLSRGSGAILLMRLDP